MELRHLRYFLAVVDEGSVTRAAAHIRVAQPSLSRQLRHLESTIGVPLFDRHRGRLQLSLAGRQFLPMARNLVARSDDVLVTMAASRETRSITLTVIAPSTTVADVIAPFLALLGPEALKVHVREALPIEVFRRLLSGEADLGVSSGPPPGQLVARSIGRFEIWAYVHAAHPWAGRSTLTLAELVTEPLVVLGPEHGTRRLFDQAVAAANLSYRAAAESNLPHVVQALAAGGCGVAILTDDERYGLHQLSIRIGDEPLRIPLVAAWDPTHYAADTIDAWAGALEEFTRKRYGLQA
jgi:DNA-binding transcriptional LysR family regulator